MGDNYTPGLVVIDDRGDEMQIVYDDGIIDEFLIIDEDGVYSVPDPRA